MNIKRVLTNKPIVRFTTLVFIALLMTFQHSCNNSLDNNKVSGNPINTAIIGISGNPGTLFGNACDESVIQVNTELVPDGTPIDFEITFSNDLPPILRGCLFDGSLTVEGGLAFVNYLAGVLIGIGDLATVNISVTVRPIDGDEESDFISVILEGVGIIPPEDLSIEVPNGMEEDPQPVFVTLSFQTVGIKPGTLAEVSISNPAIGFLNDGAEMVVVPVQGSDEAGQFVVQYTGAIGLGGAQIITARIMLVIPPELVAFCPMPPPDDLLIEATVVITQSVAAAAEPTPEPTMPP